VVGAAEAVTLRVGTVGDVCVVACGGGTEAVPAAASVLAAGSAPRPVAASAWRSRDNAIPAITARITTAIRAVMNQRRFAADDVVL
jgi:hypothetical protein